MRKSAILFMLSGGCIFSAYSPGELGGARTFGCVDVLVQPAVSEETPPGGQMIAIDLGNRCDHGVPTDFRALRVSMRREGMHGDITANPYDPRSEIREARLPASLHVHERIIFFPSDHGCSAPIEHVCVDVEGLVPEADGDTKFCWGEP